MRFLIILVLLAGCSDNEADYSSGYNDGWATGYNELCVPRSTLVKGDWDNEYYSNGFEDGRAEGRKACVRERRQ